MLNRGLQNTSRKNGFGKVRVEFAAFWDLKLKWKKSYKWISFKVRDYGDVPENVIQSFVEAISAKIREGQYCLFRRDLRVSELSEIPGREPGLYLKR